MVAYNASKGTVASLTIDLAVKLAPHGIRVNCLAPGPFDTSMMDQIRNDPERMRAYLSTIPLGRVGQEDDIKAAALFLASEAPRFVTGQTLVVDGGVSALCPTRGRRESGDLSFTAPPLRDADHEQRGAEHQRGRRLGNRRSPGGRIAAIDPSQCRGRAEETKSYCRKENCPLHIRVLR